MSRTNHPRVRHWAYTRYFPTETPGVWSTARYSRNSHRVDHRNRGVKYWRVRRNRCERHQAKMDLRAGREPFPHQPRSRAKWDAW